MGTPTVDERLNDTFSALAHPARRAMLSRLAQGEASVGELAEPLSMTLPAVSRHIRVLEKAGLVTQGRRAQYRPCNLDPRPLEAVAEWTARCRAEWGDRFDRLDDYVRDLQDARATPSPRPDDRDQQSRQQS